MKKLFLMLLVCHVSSAVMHSLRFFVAASSGVPNFPELLGVALVDETLAGYYNASNKEIEPKQDWVEELKKNDPHHFNFYIDQCLNSDPVFFQDMINDFKRFNRSGGVHVLQEMTGCDWDNETDYVTGYMQYAYNGEDFISFDAMAETWYASKQEAAFRRDRWNEGRSKVKKNKEYLTKDLRDWLKKYLDLGKNSLLRKELPSVSLLQKTSSSPVSCHATGFYPYNASLFWRKDGEELHEDVDHGEILPNHDGTFQMSVDLNLSSVTPGDWRRYDCVFQFFGVKDDIVTKLDKDVIRTNEDPSNMTVPIIAAVVVVVALALVLVGAIRFFIYRKKKAEHPPSPLDNDSETSEELNPRT